MIREGWKPPELPNVKPEDFSAAELEIITLRAWGLSLKRVAWATYRSPHTVNTHFDRIREKFGPISVGLLTRWAIRHGLVAAALALALVGCSAKQRIEDNAAAVGEGARVVRAEAKSMQADAATIRAEAKSAAEELKAPLNQTGGNGRATKPAYPGDKPTGGLSASAGAVARLGTIDAAAGRIEAAAGRVEALAAQVETKAQAIKEELPNVEDKGSWWSRLRWWALAALVVAVLGGGVALLHYAGILRWLVQIVGLGMDALTGGTKGVRAFFRDFHFWDAADNIAKRRKGNRGRGDSIDRLNDQLNAEALGRSERAGAAVAGGVAARPPGGRSGERTGVAGGDRSPVDQGGE